MIPGRVFEFSLVLFFFNLFSYVYRIVIIRDLVFISSETPFMFVYFRSWEQH